MVVHRLKSKTERLDEWRVTLDTNYVYVVHESRPESKAIIRLLRANLDGQAKGRLISRLLLIFCTATQTTGRN